MNNILKKTIKYCIYFHDGFKILATYYWFSQLFACAVLVYSCFLKKEGNKAALREADMVGIWNPDLECRRPCKENVPRTVLFCVFVVSLAPNQIVILHIVLTQCRKRIQKCPKKATSANPSNPLFHCHSTLSSATRLPSDRSSELVMSRQLSRHRKKRPLRRGLWHSCLESSFQGSRRRGL